MKKASRILALLLAVMMVVGMFAGCGNQAEPEAAPPATENNQPEANQPEANEPEAAPVEEGVLQLVWQQASGITTIFEDPWIDLQSLYPYMIFDPLCYCDPQTSSWSPALASDWTISEDGMTYTFTLREGVKWHDGEDFTADDVLFTFNTQMKNPTAKRWLLQYVEGYQACVDGEADTLSGLSADGNTITLKLTQPDSLFLNYIGACYILPEHLLKDVDPAKLSTDEAYWSKPVGTGAYVIDEVSFPDYFTVTANENFWGEKAGIKNVQFMSYDAGGSDAVVAALIAGDLDYAYGNSVNDMAVANNIVAQNADVVAKLKASGYTRFFLFNMDQRTDGNNKADLLKPEVRQAFDLLIDKNMIASFYNGQAVALSTFANPANPEYNDDIPLPQKDIETAKKMLEEAGFDFSQTIDMAYYYDDQTTYDIMQMMVQDFAAAGVTLNPQLATGDLNKALYEEPNYDILYLASGGARACDLYSVLLSTSPETYIGHVEERGALYDEIFKEYISTTDVARAKELADQLQVTDYQTRYSIPAYALNTVVVYNGARVSIPDEIFEIDGCTNYRFHEWKLLG